MILNIGSTAGLRPRPGLTWYNGTKGAVHAITKSMAVELAPERIRVCALAPVAGETPLLATFMGEDTPEKREPFRAPSRSGDCRARTTSPTRPCSSPPTRRTSITGRRARGRRRALHLTKDPSSTPGASMTKLSPAERLFALTLLGTSPC